MEPIDTFGYLAASAEVGRQRTVGASFVQQGDYWTLAYGGRTILMRNSKGLQYLAALLRSPEEKISATRLVGEGREDAAVADASTSERARSAVTKRIRDALQKIEKNHPPLGRHLNARVKTGYECVYSPDPDQPVAWQL